MQLLMLLMMMAVILHDTAEVGIAPQLDGGAMLAAALGPFAFLIALLWIGCTIGLWRLRRRPQTAGFYVEALHSLMDVSHIAAVAVFMLQIFWLGWLTWLHDHTKPTMLIGDVLVIVPVIAVFIASWWCYYPIDRHLREARVFGQIQRGEPVDIWTRWQYIASQVRINILLTLIPLLLMIGWKELIDLIATHYEIGEWKESLVLCGAALVFLLAPMLGMRILDTISLPEGPLRTRLLKLCAEYGLKVRDLRLWRTYGGMINGAVMGLFGPVRVIMLTDGLLERLSEDEVEAVMAHELAHIKRNHMIWMIVCAMGTLGALSVAVQFVIGALHLGTRIKFDSVPAAAQDAIAMCVVLAFWFVIFGLISRRFERQADVFAVQHLSRRGADPAVTPVPINAVAISVVTNALTRVALLNNIPLDDRNQSRHILIRPMGYAISLYRSWRHGSMGWRIEHLQTLSGLTVDNCPIDRVVRMICWASAALLAIVAAEQYVLVNAEQIIRLLHKLFPG